MRHLLSTTEHLLREHLLASARLLASHQGNGMSFNTQTAAPTR
jgi:hypothetical protein